MEEANEEHPQGNESVLTSAQLRLFQRAPQSPAYLLERFHYLSARLRYLVAIEGEDNHNKIKIFLDKHQALAPYLISHRGTTMFDAAGRCFKQRSAYGYLYWAGNTDLCEILDEYTDGDTKKKLHLECDQIEKEGLDFILDGELTIGSQHFAMRPVIQAAYEYNEAARPLIAAKNWQESAWKSVKPLWLNYGKELGRVPLWIAQLFCSTLRFCPLPSLKHLNIERTVLFNNLLTGASDAWFQYGKTNPLLGESIGVHKVDGDRAWGLANPPKDALERGLSDLDMLVKIHQVRMLRDPKQTLERLKSEEHTPHYSTPRK